MYRKVTNATYVNNYFFRLEFFLFWSITLVLAVVCSILRISHHFHQPGQPNQGNHLNNAWHNPALVDSLEILMVFVTIAFTTIPGIFFISDGPNEFVSANLPNIILALIVVPGLFYGFNKNLRE